MVGVDSSSNMPERARERAEKNSGSDRVEFRVGDAQELPFDPNSFDAVMCESVLAFVPDKARALGEFKRLVKPGGWIGINEGTMIKADPPPQLIDYLENSITGGGRGADFLTPEQWKALLRRV